MNCRVELADESGIVVDERSHTFPGSAAIVRNLAELVQAPANFVDGSATTSCDKQIAATGLLLGVALSELPPVVLSRQPTVITPTAPDLVVDSASVSDDTLETGQSFNLRATVRNSGDGQAGSTTLRYYRSTNSMISPSDTQVGTDAVGALGTLATSLESISLTAPSNRWRVLLRRLRGQRVRRKRHGQQLFERHTRHGVVRDDESADRGRRVCRGKRCDRTRRRRELHDHPGAGGQVQIGQRFPSEQVTRQHGSGGRVSLGFLSAQSIQLNGLTIRCR